MKVRCEKWKTCEVLRCPHHGEHDEAQCARKSYCPAAHKEVSCIEIAESVPVVTRKDSAA
jgi:hypothetical protein